MPGKNKVLTDADKKQILALFGSESLRSICGRIGCSYTPVRYFLIKEGKIKKKELKPRSPDMPYTGAAVRVPRKIKCRCPKCEVEYVVVDGNYLGPEPWPRMHRKGEGLCKLKPVVPYNFCT